MGMSKDVSQFPHTEPYARPPIVGDLIFGPGGILAVCHITPSMVVGLLVAPDYSGVVDVPLEDLHAQFNQRVLVAESIHPEGRLQ
jgi:hypothetical protein